MFVAVIYIYIFIYIYIYIFLFLLDCALFCSVQDSVKVVFSRSLVSKPKDLVSLVKNKFSSADNITALSK